MVTLDTAVAQEIVRRSLPSANVVRIEALAGGSSESFRLDLDAGPGTLVVKTYPLEPSWRPAKERLVSGWIADRLPVATQRSLLLDETCELLPKSFALLSWLPGASLRHYFGDPGLAGAYVNYGHLIRRFHELAMPAYGYVYADGIDDPQPDNARYMAAAFAGAFKRFRDRGGDDGLAQRLERAVDERFALVGHSAGAVLCHDDFHPGNVLAERDVSGAIAVTGLIDLGNARCADPLFDLAKALFCCAHEDPTSTAPLRTGYGAIDHPDLEGALWLYTLYHRVSMWAWLSRIGKPGPAELLRDLDAMLGQ
jgi:Ser/Thr protein kinase RdoA (MazF antagonist)